MLTHKHLDKWIIGVMTLAVLASLFLVLRAGDQTLTPAHPAYEVRLFDDKKVQTIDIRYDDWEGFLKNARAEQYVKATLIINGERFENIGLRTKGNNSLKLTERYGSKRFSLKVEMDHYVTGMNYYGLDKFSLDSSFQDNAYLKTYLTYDMMHFMNVATPLTSYVWVTVNGEPWGLFLAIEEPEQSFALRNYGAGHGQLYKPDYKSLNHENADVHLRYVDDDPRSYDNIFRKAKFNTTFQDKRRLIEALRILSSGEHLEQAVDIDQVLRYFAVQVFVVNLDSYLGPTGHNYFLYEEHGRISILPWDYNLAFGTYSLGMPHPIDDIEKYINHPINTPASGEVMRKRPLYHQLMLDKQIFTRYHETFDRFIRDYFESGRFEKTLYETSRLIDPYVKKDPTAFISYEDFLIGVKTIREFSLLRALSVRAQLDGTLPSTIKGQEQHPEQRIRADHLQQRDLGEIDDLKHPPLR